MQKTHKHIDRAEYLKSIALGIQKKRQERLDKVIENTEKSLKSGMAILARSKRKISPGEAEHIMEKIARGNGLYDFR
jgi:BioD-like phosphotransacetylase family protein